MEPKAIRREILQCCNFRKCPVVTIFDDGSAVLTDDDAEAGSVGTIKLRPEVAAKLAAILGQKTP